MERSCQLSIPSFVYGVDEANAPARGDTVSQNLVECPHQQGHENCRLIKINHADASMMKAALMPSTPAALCHLSLFTAALKS